MSSQGISSIAHPFHHLRDVEDRTAPIWGVVVHQTGESIVTAAMKDGADPLEYAAAYYLKPDSYFAHYVVGHNGEIIQIADEFERASHVGLTAEQRRSFLDGTWKGRIPATLVSLWEANWPNYASPSHLYPGKSVNDVYIGIEMLPVVKGLGYAPADWLPAGRFTAHQHYAVVELLVDIAKRQKLPDSWYLSSRLVTHEEVNPLTRTTKKPPAGWDPGWLRADPWFDMEWVRLQLNERFTSLNV